MQRTAAGTCLRRLARVFAGGACFVSVAWGHGAADGHGGSLTEVIAPGDTFELCRLLAPDERLGYTFTATQPLDFNIHYHAGREVYYPVPAHRAASAGTEFVAASAQEYCLMWMNPAAGPVTLSLQYRQGHP
ncbi:MAG: hypothetical protein PVI50_06040 [Gammaproteobacteria bacterium]|jgi:hypothetical protein